MRVELLEAGALSLAAPRLGRRWTRENVSRMNRSSEPGANCRVVAGCIRTR